MTVPVEAPVPVRAVEKVVTRVVQGDEARCVIPAGERRLTLTIPTTEAVRKGAAVRTTVDLARGKATVPRGEDLRIRAG